MVLLGILAEEPNETGAARVMDRLTAADAGVAEAQYAAAVLWLRAEDAGRALAAARRADRPPPMPRTDSPRSRSTSAVLTTPNACSTTPRAIPSRWISRNGALPASPTSG